MRSYFLMPATIAIALPLAWASGCSGELGGTDSSGGTNSTTTSSGSGGAGGGGEATPSEACPGEGIPLKTGESRSISDSTEGGKDDLSASCGDTSMESDAPDRIYAITVEEDGSFRASVTAMAGSAIDPVLTLRSACDNESGSEIECADLSTSKEVIAREIKAGTYYLIVDGASNTSGAFELQIDFTAPACGDSILNTGEQCDPAAVGLGCDETCKFEVPLPSQDKCPGGGGVQNVGAEGVTVVNQHTTGFTDNYSSTGCPAKPGGPDRVYQIVPEVSGTMTVSVGYDEDGMTSVCDKDAQGVGCFNRVLYVRTTCSDEGTEITCSDAGPLSPESVTFEVTEFNQYYVIVDGASAEDFGQFNLFISLLPAL